MTKTIKLLCIIVLACIALRASRSFNGTSDFAQGPTVDLTGSSSVSLDFWLILPPTPANAPISEFGANFNGEVGGWVIDPAEFNCGSRFTLEVHGAAGIPQTVGYRQQTLTAPSGISLTDGAWHHYQITMRADADTGWSAMVDGQAATLAVCQGQGSTPGGTFGKFQLNLMARNGGQSSPPSFSPGQMAEFTVLVGSQLVAGVHLCGTGTEADEVSGTWTINGTTPGTQPPGVTACASASPTPTPTPSPTPTPTPTPSPTPTPTPSGHSAILTWTASTTTTVTGYNVYRGTARGGPYTKLTSTPITGTTYTDATIQSGTAYFYVVTAVDASGSESDFSNQAGTIQPPTNLTVVSQ